MDAELTAGDVRLTMGGEPTFVSIDDMDGDEWNTAAIGPDQAAAGRRPAQARCATRFAPGGLLHFGQGKWYPGESLPRWAFTCYWRTDGVPLWREPSARRASPIATTAYGTADAQAFAEALAERLAVGPRLRDRRLRGPARLHPQGAAAPDQRRSRATTTLDDPEERERLRRVFSRGLGTPTGFVLPLARVPGKDGPLWQSGLWMLRARHLFLIPGDSPVGFRLPLDSLPGGPVLRGRFRSIR